jgi:cellobiose-specific phosphotransferase system component IIB
MAMKETGLEKVEGPVRLDSDVYVGAALGVKKNDHDFVVIGSSIKEMKDLFEEFFPDKKVDVDNIKMVCIGRHRSMTLIREK